jgi:dienelactone hydrolase
MRTATFSLTAFALVFTATAAGRQPPTNAGLMDGPPVRVKSVDYNHDAVVLKGHLAEPPQAGRRPGVLVVHEWWGLDDYARRRANQLAELGYVALAADMYGDGRLAKHPDDAKRMYDEIRQNTANWRARAAAGLRVLRNNPNVDPSKLAVIGYCFGGSTAIQMAYADPDLAAAVSFHGGLAEPVAGDLKNVKAKILVCHGADDTFIPEDVCRKVRAAWDNARLDYKFVYYSRARHSFTVLEAATANIPGIEYNETADRRSWQDMLSLFNEAFKK